MFARARHLAGGSCLVVAFVAAGYAAGVPLAAAQQSATVTEQSYYPPSGDSWARRRSTEAGIDSARLADAVSFALANEIPWLRDMQAQVAKNVAAEPYPDVLGPVKDRGGPSGIILHNGYVVAEWGDTRRVDMTFSVAKSYLATTAGLALDRGLIRDVRDSVARYVNDGGFGSAQNRAITWHQLLNQTSEWEGTLWDKPDVADRRAGRDRTLQTPGTFWEYNDVRVNRAALALLRVFKEPLPVVLKREIMDPIGASPTWEWHGYRNAYVTIDGTRMPSVSGGGHWGGGVWASTRDHARFGLLMSRGGKWRDKQLLSERWVKMATTPTDMKPVYGYMWWLNTNRAQYPAASERAFFALGAGGNVIWIEPEHDLVAVVRWMDTRKINEFMGMVRGAVVAESGIGNRDSGIAGEDSSSNPQSAIGNPTPALGTTASAIRNPQSAVVSSSQLAVRSSTADSALKIYVVPGERAGPSIFPRTNYPEVRPLVAGELDWKHYHTSAEIEMWMRKWAEQYPDLVELYSVGQSYSGRPLWQLTLTNKKTGKHTDKPAAFFEGGRHSGEITATESAFYLAWHLLENYANDPEIRKLLDEKAVYVRPVNNPDGSDLYRLTAQTNRSSVRPHDTDRDGLLDEDPGEDLDGDGYIRDMRVRVGKGKGDWILDSQDRTRRALKRVREKTGDWQVYPEGIDNDLDGKYNEDGVGGLDLHRNYTQNWRPEPGQDSTGRGYTQFGAGAYPLSEPETRAVVMWVLTHPNIGVVNTMDTAVPMHLRPPSTCEETECMYASDLALYEHFDSVGTSITKYPWAGDVFRTYNTRSKVNPVTGDSTRPEPLFGHSPDFGYFSYGAIWYGDELWNGGRERDYDGDGDIEGWEVLRFCDENFAGKCFKPWTKYRHPQLGDVEIGGLNPKFFSQNGPPEVLEKWARNQALFNVYMAQSLPRIEITDAVVTTLSAPTDSATHEIRVTVRNTGRMPTALEQAKRVKIVRPDQVTAKFADSSAAKVVGPPPEFWLAGGESKTVALRIRAGEKATNRKVTIRALSTRGGVAERELEVGAR